MNRSCRVAVALLLAGACTPRESARDSTAGSAAAVPSATPTPTPPPAAAAPSAVTYYGMGALRGGMTIAEARAALPSLAIPAAAETGSCEYARSAALPDSVMVLLEGGRVGRVDVYGGRTRTAEGAGIGDSETRVKSLYGSRVVVTPHKYSKTGHYLTVRPADARDSAFAIVFETERGSVTRIHAGVEPQVHYIEGCA